MSYSYTGYQLRQADYHPWQPVSQPLLHPTRALDQQPSYTYPQDGRLHPQHHPYQARQPTSWDPPRLRQETVYQQPSSYETDLYSPPPPSCWDPPRLCTQQPYQPPQQPHHTALRQPTSWDPPAYWETTGQRPFHGVSAYDHPLPPNHNSGWNQPAPQPPPRHIRLSHNFNNCWKRATGWSLALLQPTDALTTCFLPSCLNLRNPTAPLVQHLPPSGNSKASLGPSGLPPYDSLAPPQQSSTTPPPFALLPDTALELPPLPLLILD
ncbi:leucine-rich repeat extensin-like protein 3 [Salvia splendens]|uniref:leucine-rich repeat extensin-like protein 3 n=1 Tax=Salvia splendens TaxID=180675 RepID=UPI001C2718AD|nr:leucine-rich repeat extensin-like protein 3 [Salvia splendens]